MRDRREQHRFPGYTLIELLVVIGIIVILIGILLPTLARARQSAQTVECASNLRQIALMAHTIAAERGGYLPLDGSITISSQYGGPGQLAVGVGDPFRKRYHYTHDTGVFPGSTSPPTKESPTPLLVVVLQSSHRGGDPRDPTTGWSGSTSAQMLQCPTAYSQRNYSVSGIEGMYSSILYIDEGSSSVGYANPCYPSSTIAINAGVLGYHYAPDFSQSRLAGCLSKIRNPSQVVLCGDSGEGSGICWVPRIKGVRRAVTLADILRSSPEVETSSLFTATLDKKRHRGYVNIAFVDGHVATIPISEAELSGCYLLPG